MSGLALFGTERDDARASVPETTGSIGRAKTAANTLPPDTDLVFAKVAAIDVLGRGGKTASAPWENPKSGARGTVTPVADAYTQDGTTCRDFLASYLRGKSEAWMQGQGCKGGNGKWEIKTLRPWKRS